MPADDHFVTFFKCPPMTLAQYSSLEVRIFNDLIGWWDYRELFDRLGMHEDQSPFVTRAFIQGLLDDLAPEESGFPEGWQLAGDLDVWELSFPWWEPDPNFVGVWNPQTEIVYNFTDKVSKIIIALSSWRLSIQWRIAAGLSYAGCISFHQHGGSFENP